MNAITDIVAQQPMPKLKDVRHSGQYRVEVVWAAGIRIGRREIIDLSPLIKSFRFYAPLRKSQVLFGSVHLIADGHAIAWGEDDAIDMSVTSIERLAQESMSDTEFREFIDRHSFTHAAAAAVLGRSRRQIENYLAGHPIPRIVALACIGLETHRYGRRPSWTTHTSVNYFLPRETQLAVGSIGRNEERFKSDSSKFVMTYG